MILYHGSNMLVENIDLSLSKKGKDFGCGFYLSSDKKQAEELAEFKVVQLGGVKTINEFDFDESHLTDGSLNVKVFNAYDEEWANFVFANRNNYSDTPVHTYDIVYGPIADDRVGVQIRLLKERNIDMATFIERLKYMKGITFQFFFGTSKAINLLRRL